jgi:hypothetical protein
VFLGSGRYFLISISRPIANIMKSQPGTSSSCL